MKKFIREKYHNHVLPHIIEYACSIKDITKTRAKVVPHAHGRVLEIGIGTGLNLPFYDVGKVHSVTGVDPAAAMHHRARKRAAQMPIPVETVALELGEIQAESKSFDTIVCTFTLCSIPDVSEAFREMRRVLKPGGRFLFCEHGRAPDEAVARWQDRLTPLWKPMLGGCHLNRDIPALVREGGFTLESLESGYIPGPKPMTWIHHGSAK